MAKRSILSILLSILLIFMFLSSCNGKNSSENGSKDNGENGDQTTLHISPVMCGPMLEGITPIEFCKYQGQGTFLHDKYISAYVDQDGCLILKLKNEVLKEWKNTFTDLQVLQCVLGDSRDIGITIDYSYDFMNYMKDAHTCGYEISEDFTKVIESPEDNSWYFPFTTLACATMQVFEGKTCTEIKVEHIEIDDKGEVIEVFIFPDNAETSNNDAD